MKNKNGFTLVELLAVVLVLGIATAIVTLSVVGIKRNAAKETFKRLEKQITDLGPQIHSHEFLMGDKTNTSYYYNMFFNVGDPFIIKIGSSTEEGTLIKEGYIKEIKNPFGSGTCDGYLYVDPRAATDADMFIGKLKCGDGANEKSVGYVDDYGSTITSAKISPATTTSELSPTPTPTPESEVPESEVPGEEEVSETEISESPSYNFGSIDINKKVIEASNVDSSYHAAQGLLVTENYIAYTKSAPSGNDTDQATITYVNKHNTSSKFSSTLKLYHANDLTYNSNNSSVYAVTSDNCGYAKLSNLSSREISIEKDGNIVNCDNTNSITSITYDATTRLYYGRGSRRLYVWGDSFSIPTGADNKAIYTRLPETSGWTPQGLGSYNGYALALFSKKNNNTWENRMYIYKLKDDETTFDYIGYYTVDTIGEVESVDIYDNKLYILVNNADGKSGHTAKDIIYSTNIPTKIKGL